MEQEGAQLSRKEKIVQVCTFLLISVGWVLFDSWSKSIFVNGEPDGIIAGPFLGLFQFRLVHNTGGAWGIFSDNTAALGVFSIVVCAALALYFFATLKRANVLQTIALALIVGGGIGNAIDRFMQGFVTDFIEFSFMDFPVFNVADIGVTCGFALILISLAIEWIAESRRPENESSEAGE